MKKRLNKKRLVLLLTCLLFVGLVGGYFGGRYLLHRRVEAWRVQGIAASKAGEHARASDLLIRYLQRRSGGPDYIEALNYYIGSREKAELANGQHLGETIAAI